MGCNRDVISPISLKRPLCHRTLAQTLISPQSPESLSESPSPVSVGPGYSRNTNGSLVQQAYNSLSSIPFIGLCSFVKFYVNLCFNYTSEGYESYNAHKKMSTHPPIHFLIRLSSQGSRVSSIKGRRSSYLLAISTERSKSCDEGLNTLKEEGHVLTRLPKRVKSFFIDGSLESLKAQEEARSKRHSTSELGSITFSDICKEGWLHYKQILTDKGKKVGSSMRTWKRLFFVLRSRVLFIYKDKREAILHGTGPGSGLDEHPPINICGCLIDIAYRETKRKHTLRLMTQDFCEYLLQAENRDEMLAWIKVITENSKTDNEEIGSSRQTPWGINIMKKSKKTDNPKAFGVRLENCQQAVHHKFVPQIVEMCCGVVEATGLDYTGIYRVPGNNAMVSNLQEHLNKGFDINTAEEVRHTQINGNLNQYDNKYIYFIDANRIEDTRDRLKTLKKLIHDLPDHYYHTLKFLMCHLKRVADHSEKNKMEPRNLALVFGPTLVRTSEDNMTDMVTHMPDRYKIVETLILHCDWFFSGGELDKQQNAPDEEMQHMPNIDHLLCNIGRTGMPGETSGKDRDTV
uniref:Rho GTPase activating protein 23b n=1 Tax=Hippocampus comes TaxID=109280 RepID=A0A3Q2Z674_HIPCM